jgi:hypothetical protein
MMETTGGSSMRRPRWLAGALLTALLCQAASQGEESVGGLFEALRSGIRAGHSDADSALLAGNARLSERLDDAVIEQLIGEGAGPLTIEALERQREMSHHLRKAAPLPLADAPAPAPSAEERGHTIEQARSIAMHYTAALPDFVCTQTVRRYSTPQKSAAWKSHDVLLWEVGFSGRREQYKLLSINGQPTRRNEVRGATSSGEFGSTLEMIYKPESATKFEWERWATLRGRAAYVFSYAIDQPHSGYSLNDLHVVLKSRRIIVALRGLVYIDRDSHQTLRFTTEAVGVPSGFAIAESRSAVDYGTAKVGEQEYFLPRRSDLAMVSGGILHRNVIEFRDYRKFSSDATLTFEK